MSNSRARILGQIRTSLRRTGPLSTTIQSALEDRLRAAQPHVKPHFEGDIVDRFVLKVDAAAGDVEQLVGMHNVSRAVVDYIEREGLPKELVAGSDPTLRDIQWSNELAVSHRRAEDADRVSITTAFAGIAETGTVVLLSDPTSPTTLNFMPEHHIVLVKRSRIVAHLEDVWTRLRDETNGMPRTVNLITGPSRTGDVELNMEFGAHGPRRLYVLLIAD